MIKKLIVFFSLFLVFSGAAPASDTTLFEQANAKYGYGDFKIASEIYQRLIQAGRATAAVYYNLGNASLKAGDKGHALLFYERALKVAPRDQDLRWNVHILKESLADRTEDNSYFAFTAVKEFLGRWTPDEMAVLFSCLLAIFSVLTVFSAFFPFIKTWVGWIRNLAVLCLIVITPLFGFKTWDTKDPRVMVLDKETYAYYGPSERETKAFLLHEGASGKVTDKTDDWIQITLANKKSGWIRKNSCEII